MTEEIEFTDGRKIKLGIVDPKNMIHGLTKDCWITCDWIEEDTSMTDEEKIGIAIIVWFIATMVISIIIRVM